MLESIKKNKKGNHIDDNFLDMCLCRADALENVG